MSLPSYTILEKADDYSEYKFISTGPSGDVVKVIAFQKLPVENLYNLSLLDIMNDGRLSDTNLSNNSDLRKILATTIKTLIDYTEIFPERIIFFQGSDDGRRITLYQKAIAKYYYVLERTFAITGITDAGIEEEFNLQKQYIAFLVKRK